MLDWLFNRDGKFSLLRDFREGKAGALPRLALSLASGVATCAVMMVFFAFMEASNNLRDEQAAIAVAISGVVWCAMLWVLWTGYTRFLVLIRTGFALIALWVATIAACIIFEAIFQRGEEFFIAAAILSAIALTIGIITIATYQSMRGKPVRTSTGSVQVNCPECGYSLVGLTECKCPECGKRFMIDELIALQEYEGTRAMTTRHPLTQKPGSAPPTSPPPVPPQSDEPATSMG